MSATASPAFLAEEDWQELLLYIQYRQVIPVVGPELVTVAHEGGRLPLTRWLAPRLAEHLKLPEPARFSALNEVACAYLLGERSDRQQIYTGLRLLLGKMRLEPPPALLQLAKISDFDLFVTSTFDPLLGLALEQVRPGFARSRDVLAYDTKPKTPFPDPLPASLVYHILGRLETFPDFAVWEEDYMEYLCHLIEQSGEDALAGLFRQIRSRHLLLLGAPFADWVVRLFLRTARGERLTERRRSREYLTDQRANLGEPTVFFFNHLARATRVVEGDPGAFVAELFARWSASCDVSGSAQDFLERLPSEMPRDAVFVSYAHEDRDAACRLALQLHQANVPVWLDKERLRVGQDYERSLEHAVRNCSFFLSLVSTATEGDAARYVHRERAWAASRFQDGYVFYLPIIVDETPDAAVKLEPECFARIHRNRLPGGEANERFIQRLRSLVESYRASGSPRD